MICVAREARCEVTNDGTGQLERGGVSDWGFRLLHESRQFHDIYRVNLSVTRENCKPIEDPIV